MAKVVSARAADQPVAAIGTDVIYRKLFDSFNPGQDGRISHWEVLTRLQRSGLQPDDPRIAEALAGLKVADGAPRQISFQQFKALASATNLGAPASTPLALGALTHTPSSKRNIAL